MPRRKTFLANGEIYHTFNKSIASEPIFLSKDDYERFTNLADYYRFKKPTLRFSHFNRLNSNLKNDFLKNLYLTGEKNVQVFAFCWMPNHFHFLLKQLNENGISNFIRNLQNSYAKYLNTKYKRNGSLFQEMFKATHIQSDTQLIHILRYIHLNPLTSYLIKDIHELETFPWTSFPDYTIEPRYDFLETEFMLKFFKTKTHFKKFTYNQLDYQRKLAWIKHAALE
jgi:putative transposase